MELIEKIKVVLKEDSESVELDFEKIHESAVLNLKQTPPKPPILISAGRDQNNSLISISTLGNISVIIGEEKSRKTWFKSLVLGCLFGGNSEKHSDFIQGHDLGDKLVLNIDTEQGRYDVWRSAIRIPQIIGGKHSPTFPDSLINISIREYSPTQRLKYLDWLVFKSQYRGKIGLIVIDGYVDMVNDFNSQSESIEFVSKLMQISTLANCHIMGVLHANTGTDKGRGHLGTILQQKAESVIFVQKDGSVSKIIPKSIRGMDFEPFELSVGPDYLPYANSDNFIKQEIINTSYLPNADDVF